MKNVSIFFFLVLIIAGGCKQEPKEQPVEAAPMPEKIDMSEGETYPIMTKEKAKFLFDNADKVDVLFTDVAVSLSQVKQSDVRGQVSFLMPGAVPIDHKCSESANIILQAAGEIVADGRMYLRGKCRYVVFYEDSKPAYGAFMTDQGMQFYGQILAAGTSTVKQ